MRWNVAICDDDAADAETLCAMTSAWLRAKGHPADVRVFDCGEALIASTERWDMLLIDVLMPGRNGIETVQAMGANAPKALVFITSSRDYAVEAFGLRAAHYLMKPITVHALDEALTRCSNRMETNEPVLEIRSGHGSIPVPVGSIRYAEIQNKRLLIHTEQQEVETYMPLDALVAQLPADRFVKAQRSYVINLDYVQSCLFDRLCLRDGTEVMLSRANRAETRAKYQQYLFQMARRCSQ